MKRFYSILGIIILFHTFYNKSYGQAVIKPATDSATALYDSLNIYPASVTDVNYVSSKRKIISVRTSLELLAQAKVKNDVQAEANALLHISDSYIAYGNHRKAYAYLVKALKMKDAFNDDITVAHLYYNLAIVLSRLKQYSDAAKCFYKTGFIYQQTAFKRKRKQVVAIDTGTVSHMEELYENNKIDEDMASSIFSDSLIDASVLNRDTAQIINNPVLEESPGVDYNDMLDAFYDDKPAFAYAIFFHVKQPTPGRANVFAQLSKVGHTFITLLKFNNDNSVVSKSFGFYPSKDNILSGTPILPFSNSQIKNDSLHDWDESIAKFIPVKKFIEILDFVNDVGDKHYDLNYNNCTDFALKIAAIANIGIADTKSGWLLGRGNNPAATGQSILRGKFKNADTQNQHGLFACSNNLFIHRATSK